MSKSLVTFQLSCPWSMASVLEVSVPSKPLGNASDVLTRGKLNDLSRILVAGTPQVTFDPFIVHQAIEPFGFFVKETDEHSILVNRQPWIQPSSIVISPGIGLYGSFSGISIGSSLGFSWGGTTQPGSNLVASLCVASTAVITPPAGWNATPLSTDTVSPGIIQVVYVAYGASAQSVTTFTVVGSTQKAILGVEITNPTASPVDANVQSSGTGTTATSAATGVLARSNEVAVALLAGLQVAGGPSWSNGYSMLSNDVFGSQSQVSGALVLSSTSSTSTSITSVLSGTWNLRLITL